MSNRMLILICSFFCLQTHGQLVGFKSGNQFSKSFYSGTAQVRCSNYGIAQTRTVDCQSSMMTPKSFDFFIGPKISADKFILENTDLNGNKKVKDGKYNSALGQSVNVINLGVTTLLQRPLLKIGVNMINYQLFNKKILVDQGTFAVEVKDEGNFRCPIRYYSGFDYMDCSNAQNICDRYFDDVYYACYSY